MNTEIKEMEITDYNILRNIVAALYRLWKLKLIVVFSTAIGALLAIAFVTYQGNKTSYYSTASIYSAVYGSYSETVSGITIMNTYSSLLGTSRVCERAAAEIDDSEITSEYLMQLVSAKDVYLSGASSESKNYGYRLTLTTMMDTSDKVIQITNAMANAYVAELNDLLGTDNLQVFDKAANIYMVTGKSKYLYIALFAAIGFFLSVAIIFIKEFFSSKVYIVSQCISDKSKILGLLPYTK